MTKKKPLVFGVVTTLVAGLGLTLTQTAFGTTQKHETAATSAQSQMTFVTANIGRDYLNKKTKVCHGNVPAAAMDRIRNKLYEVSGGKPRFIGWQEIDEDNCANETKMLKSAYPAAKGWEQTLSRAKPNGGRAPLKVPNVAHGAKISGQRVTFGSTGVKGHSPRRYNTVTRYQSLGVSHINTHFIAGAFKNCSKCAGYRKLWSAHWDRLKTQVAREHKDGFDVVVTADWNRKVGEWNPAKLHKGAKLVHSSGLDHIVALPAGGRKVSKVNSGLWPIGIDGHSAQWVKLSFSKG